MGTFHQRLASGWIPVFPRLIVSRMGMGHGREEVRDVAETLFGEPFLRKR